MVVVPAVIVVVMEVVIAAPSSLRVEVVVKVVDAFPVSVPSSVDVLEDTVVRRSLKLWAFLTWLRRIRI